MERNGCNYSSQKSNEIPLSQQTKTRKQNSIALKAARIEAHADDGSLHKTELLRSQNIHSTVRVGHMSGYLISLLWRIRSYLYLQILDRPIVSLANAEEKSSTTPARRFQSAQSMLQFLQCRRPDLFFRGSEKAHAPSSQLYRGGVWWRTRVECGVGRAHACPNRIVLRWGRRPAQRDNDRKDSLPGTL